MTTRLGEMTKIYPEKFAVSDKIFNHIHRGARIFIGTGCGEPQCLVHALINYVESNPTVFFDAEVFHVWTLGPKVFSPLKVENVAHHLWTR
jgi:acyl-CoA hydrolase